ncbi:MAG: hypothetical protein PHY43_01110 [Verrucomicrobiales bacterium]|nr:hypothetical protein [Verrucomicrobiales bacterium]
MMTMKQILRWLAVLPGAILAGFIILFPVHWVAMFIHYFGNSGDGFITTNDGRSLLSLSAMPLESLERFMDALFVPGTIVAAGSRIAPRFHFVTAVVITLLLAGLLAFLFAQLSSNDSEIVDSPFRIVVTIILWLVGVIVALSFARELDTET